MYYTIVTYKRLKTPTETKENHYVRDKVYNHLRMNVVQAFLDQFKTSGIVFTLGVEDEDIIYHDVV